MPSKWLIILTMVRLEPLAEVERALLVVEVLKAPDPELLGLSVGNSLEHFDVVDRNTIESRECAELYTPHAAPDLDRKGCWCIFFKMNLLISGPGSQLF